MVVESLPPEFVASMVIEAAAGHSIRRSSDGAGCRAD